MSSDPGNMASWVTATGVLIAALQLALTRRQEKGRFEDDLSKQYRCLVRELPVEAALHANLAPPEVRQYLSTFVAYFDLCNEQIYLRMRGRISSRTWREWDEGIRDNLKSKPFASAWTEVDRPGGPFNELRSLLASNTRKYDPIQVWPWLLGYLTLSW